jgi:hypothetical protein
MAHCWCCSGDASQQWASDQQLFKFVVEEDVENIRKLLSQGTDVNKRDEEVRGSSMCIASSVLMTPFVIGDDGTALCS